MEYHDKMTRHAPALGGEATTRVSERPDPFLKLNPLFHHTSDGNDQHPSRDERVGCAAGHSSLMSAAAAAAPSVQVGLSASDASHRASRACMDMPSGDEHAQHARIMHLGGYGAATASYGSTTLRCDTKGPGGETLGQRLSTGSAPSSCTAMLSSSSRTSRTRVPDLGIKNTTNPSIFNTAPVMSSARSACHAPQGADDICKDATDPLIMEPLSRSRFESSMHEPSLYGNATASANTSIMQRGGVIEGEDTRSGSDFVSHAPQGSDPRKLADSLDHMERPRSSASEPSRYGNATASANTSIMQRGGVAEMGVRSSLDFVPQAPQGSDARKCADLLGPLHSLEPLARSDSSPFEPPLYGGAAAPASAPITQRGGAVGVDARSSSNFDAHDFPQGSGAVARLTQIIGVSVA